MNLLFVIKYRIPEYTLHILMCYLRGSFPWTPQMLPTINCQHYTCITEFLRLIIRQQQHPLTPFLMGHSLCDFLRYFRLKCIWFTTTIRRDFFLFLTSLQIHFIILVTEKVYTLRVIYRDFPWEQRSFCYFIFFSLVRPLLILLANVLSFLARSVIHTCRLLAKHQF